MAKKQLIALFLCNLAVFTVGGGMIPLLPVYARKLGADETLAGLYLAFAFLALAISAIFAGWLSNRFQRRKLLLIGSGILMVPTVYLMGQVTSFVALTILTALLWFLAGISATMTSILTGLFVHDSERGRIFGIIGLAMPISGILGGLAAGPIVDRWGYQALFTAGAAVYALQPIFGLMVMDRQTTRQQHHSAAHSTQAILLGRAFLVMFFASILAHVANSQIVLGRSLIMDSKGFDATAITSTGAIGAIISMPFPVFIGWLSDRLGRKPLIMLCYFGSLVGLVVLALAFDLWHFWVALALQSLIGAGVVVGSALITDLVPRDAVATPLSVYSSTQFIGYVIGFGGMGTVIQMVGLTNSLIIGMVLAAVAMGLMTLIPRTEVGMQVEPAQ